MKKGGVGGLLLGSFQGIAGLLVKPVAGVIDATSKTAEGIKNTATHFDDKPNEKKQRNPRAFYSKDKYFKAYSSNDADVLMFLQTFKKGKFAEASLIELTIIEIPDPQGHIHQYLLIITSESLLFVQVQNMKLLWHVENNTISRLEPVADGLKLHLFSDRKGAKKMKNIKVSIFFPI